MAAKNTRPVTETRDAPVPAAHTRHFTDIAALSTHLGVATLDEVRVITAAHSDTDLVALGDEIATPRITSDSVRVYNVAANFFETASAEDQEDLDLSPDVVRIGAWAAAEDARVNESLRASKGDAKAREAGALAEAEETVARAVSEKKKLVATLRSVGQRQATEAAIAHALAPAQHNETSTGPDVSLRVLVAEGRALLASKDEGIRKRVPMYRLTAAKLDKVDKLRLEAASAAKLIAAPKAVVTQHDVDWWDGASVVILQSVVQAFQAGHATNPRIPSIELVSLRKRSAATSSTEQDGEKKDAPESDKTRTK